MASNLSVRVKNADGNTVNRTLIKAAPGTIDTTASKVKALVNAYQAISTDRIDTTTGVHITITRTNETTFSNADYPNFVTVAGGADYMDNSEDVLVMKFDNDNETQTVNYSSVATWSTVAGGSPTESEWRDQVRTFARAIYNMASVTPMTANMTSKVNHGNFTTNDDG